MDICLKRCRENKKAVIRIIAKMAKANNRPASNKSSRVNLWLAAWGLNQMQTETMLGRDLRGGGSKCHCPVAGKPLGHWHRAKKDTGN